MARNEGETKKPRRRVVLACVLSVVLVIVVGIISYACVAVVPYSRGREVSPGFRESRDADDFYSDEDCGERAGVLDDGDEAYYYRMKAVQGAEEEIWFVAYSTEDNYHAQVFWGALIEKAREGVRVNVLLDGKYSGITSGSGKTIGYAVTLEENVELYLYNELNVFRPEKINALMHDKFLIVDSSVLILGGRNLSGRYYGEPGRIGDVVNDREIMIYDPEPVPGGGIDQAKDYYDCLSSDPANRLVEAPAGKKAEKGAERADELVETYRGYEAECLAEDADFYGFTVPTNKVTLIYNPVNAGVKEPWIAERLFSLMEAEEGNVVIQTPYLLLKNSHLDYLTGLVGTCESVDLLTNSPASSPNFGYTNYYVRRKRVLECGMDIYEYQSNDDSIHAKTFIFGDRISAVGSFNLDERSMYIDTESMVVVDSEEFNALLRGTVRTYEDRSLKVGEDNRYEESDTVEEADFTFSKRIMIYTTGNLLRPFISLL